MITRKKLEQLSLICELQESMVMYQSFQLTPSPELLTLDEIITGLNDYFKVDIRKKIRKREVVTARQVYYLIARDTTKHSLSIIGKEVGGYHHTTVLHGRQTCKDIMEFDDNFRVQVDKLSKHFEQKLKAA
jgi:chromosomal replication initiation ATPase DnaA